MITEYIAPNGTTLFKVRVFAKSAKNPILRATRQQAGFKTRLEAEKEEVKLRRDCTREIQKREMCGILLCDLVDKWFEHELKTKVSLGLKSKLNLEDYLGSFKKWFGEYLKEPAVSLNSFRVNQVFFKMNELGLSFSHKKKMKLVVKAIFDFGIQSGLLPTVQRSPTFDVVLKRDEERKPEILSESEIRKLLSKAYEKEHPWRRIWAAALLTGMRSGELYALEWKDVRWETQHLSVTKSYSARFKIVKSTKAGYWRDVPISPDLERVLREQFEETGQTQHVFPRMWEWQQGVQAEILRRFCFVQGLPSIKFHTLRACFATQMLKNGVEAAKVMKVCGWKDLKTMQFYVRLAGIEIKGVTDLLKVLPSISPSEALDGAA